MPISIRRINRTPSQSDVRRPTPKISMPLVLQSSTNLNLNNMMDLQTAQKMMAARGSSNVVTPGTATEPELTDGSSANSSPAIEHNHLSSYFPGPAGAAARAADTSAPSVPKRVPSHSKREHERLARKRSLRGSDHARTTPSASPSISAVATPERTSLELIGVNGSEPPPKTSTPAKHRSPRLDNGAYFPELEQLTEAVEEQLRTQPVIDDEDTIYMRKRGLVRLDASDYCSGIGNPFDLPSPFNAGFSSSDMGAWI